MAKTPTKLNYLIKYIQSAVAGGDYAHKSFPSERALAAETSISLTTVRKAVQDCIDHGYLVRSETSRQPEVSPHYAAQHPSVHVAVLLPSFPAISHTEWYGAIEEVCARHAYAITMASYHDGEDPALIRHINGPYDYIFMLPPPRPSPLLVSQMKKNAERLITLFHDYTNLGISTICDPPSMLVSHLLRHLFEKNCRVIHFVNAAQMPNLMIQHQIDAWKQFLAENKCKGSLLCTEGDAATPHYVKTRHLVRETLPEQNRLPDAFICSTAQGAIGVVRGLADCSLRAGLDVKVAAISPNEIIRYMTPSITGMNPIVKEKLIEIALQENRPLHIEYDEIALFIGESTHPYK